MNEICVWKVGEWCYSHDLPHRVEEYGTPDLQFELPFQLPYDVECAWIESILPNLLDRL